MTGRLFALAVALAAISSGPGQAQPSYYATCRSGDLRGTWRADILETAVPEAEAFYVRYPHQYVRFGYQGAYMSVGHAQPLADKAAIDASLDRADAADPATYVARVVDDQGKVVITRDGKPYAAYMCVMQDDRMIWSEVKGNPKVVRVHRPVVG